MLTRNEEVNLNALPKVNVPRSIFNRPFNHKTSFDVGQLIPFYVDEVIAGDSHNITTHVVARLQTLLTPIMDNMSLQTYYFYTPFRILWDHWQQFCGENDRGPWITDKVEYKIPYLTYPDEHVGVPETYPGGFDEGSLADYFGVPIYKYHETPVDPGEEDTFSDKNYPMALPFRAYAMIVDQFFRDTNLQQPIVVHTDDSNREGKCAMDAGDDWYVTDLELGGKPFNVCRFHDYFSDCLPGPQRSPDVSIFGTFNDGNVDNQFGDTALGPFAPVVARSKEHVILSTSSGAVPGMQAWRYRSSTTAADGLLKFQPVDGARTMQQAGLTDTVERVVPNNLWASLNIPEATISNLRMAFQLQKYYEKSARAGDRYRSYLAEFFGVDNGDARLQIPEYLGGHSVPLSVHQVANTSQSSEGDLGDLGAMSNTYDVHEDFHASFSEPGLIIGLMCVRYQNTYSQGLERMWSRRDITDFYNPVFCAVSDQPVFARELALGMFAPGASADRVWGYAPCWQEYRIKPNRVSGEMRPESLKSLASWHLADDYTDPPILDSEWIQMDKNIVDRVLAVGSNVANQVFCDIFVENKCVRPMPMYGIPGFSDHF